MMPYHLHREATRFVSYAWQYSWKVVFSALEAFEEEQAAAGIQERTFYFIDQFCLVRGRTRTLGTDV